jgi:hypothetical protein
MLGRRNTHNWVMPKHHAIPNHNEFWRLMLAQNSLLNFGNIPSTTNQWPVQIQRAITPPQYKNNTMPLTGINPIFGILFVISIA